MTLIHNPVGQKCVCLQSYQAAANPKTICLEFVEGGENRFVCDRKGCGHAIQCHSMPTPAEPMVSISLKDAETLRIFIYDSDYKLEEHERAAYGNLIQGIAAAIATHQPAGEDTPHDHRNPP